MDEIKNIGFGNGKVYALKTSSGKIVETTDTFLPLYTKTCVRECNTLIKDDFGSRSDRWMIGVSVMSGCLVGCKFCATGTVFNGNLTSEEIIEQVEFIIRKNTHNKPQDSDEFKILLTRMGEPALNYKEVNKAIIFIKEKYPFAIISISTIGIDNLALLTWLALYKKYKGIELQFSIHTTSKEDRKKLIPMADLEFVHMREFGKRWVNVGEDRNRKITLNFTLTEGNEFDIKVLRTYFPKEHFFIKLTPLNNNKISIKNNLNGIIKKQNIM